MSSLTTKAKTLVVTLSLVFSLPLLAGCDQEKRQPRRVSKPP